MRFAFVALVASLLVCGALADVYMHNPRGSNNRLNGNNQNRDNANRMFDSQNNDKGGYCWGPSMYFYAGSELMIEWTAQHACNNPKVHCNVVLQYMCGDEVRDGTTTDTIPDNEGQYNQQVNPNPLEGGEPGPVFKYGMHEDYQYYQDCKTRDRNRGLFTADQNMNGRDSAKHTRQDNNGNRNGFECPEERDYYPYWHPSPWKDIAVLVDDEAYCDYFQAESQNVKPKNYCSEMQFNNQIQCVENGGTWMKRTSWEIEEPDCVESQFTRSNHLGNSAKHEDHEGYASSYNWTIPNDLQDNCVVRIRYNISTGDYEGWGFNGEDFANATWNDDLSPVHQDEEVIYFNEVYEMALNTDQYGRTFEDRSHVFHIRERPSWVDDDAKIYNVNVRGKRGNIVQVYPAVEYDFVPNLLHTRVGDYIHYQWTGCDTNPANNDGEGTRQTDRSNIAQMISPRHNKPIDDPERNDLVQMFEDYEAQYRMAFIDQVGCDPNTEDEEDVTNCKKLNAAETPYFDGGIFRMNRTGTWYYMCTRNNNFSNRSQKATVVTDQLLPGWAIPVAIAGTAVFAIGAVAAGVLLYVKSHGSAAAGAAGIAAVA